MSVAARPNDTVTLSVDAAGVALVRMEERAYKNTFSPRLVEALLATFAEIETRDEIRTVVVTGYDNYFCCGGTQEELLAMHQGRLRFTDFSFYDLLLRCELPVVAAMQGHGIGGGLSFGCFADAIVLAGEAFYGATFMKYGFTPGFGATYVIPKKFGEVLGHEMLLSAGNYSGWELRQRGAPMRVVAKQDVLRVAMGLAAELADKPARSLKLLKKQLVARTRAECEAAVAAELAMQEATFALPEVRERIERLFDAAGAGPGRGGP